MNEMIEKRTWEEFKNLKLLWFINQTLHLFGWAIVTKIENDKIIECFPARVKFRGFSEKVNEEGYIKLTEYLKENIDKLDEEVKLLQNKDEFTIISLPYPSTKYKNKFKQILKIKEEIEEVQQAYLDFKYVKNVEIDNIGLELFDTIQACLTFLQNNFSPGQILELENKHNLKMKDRLQDEKDIKLLGL